MTQLSNLPTGSQPAADAGPLTRARTARYAIAGEPHRMFTQKIPRQPTDAISSPPTTRPRARPDPIAPPPTPDASGPSRPGR